jgi:CHAD domain-containing protein
VTQVSPRDKFTVRPEARDSLRAGGFLKPFFENVVVSLYEGSTQYHALLKKCRKNPKRNFVHDFRTQTRRLVTVLSILEEMASKESDCKKIHSLRKKLKLQASCVKALRDLQVQEKRIERQNHRAKSVEDFLIYLRDQRATEEKKVKRGLSRVSLRDSGSLLLGIEKIVKELSDLPRYQEGVDHVISRSLTRHYRDILKSAKAARGTDPESLHETRIQFRKYRYTWEVLRPSIVMPKSVELQMKKIQDLLGEIQDLSVLIQNLYHFLVLRGNDHPDFTYLIVLRSFEKKQETLIARFFQEKDHLLSTIKPSALSLVVQRAA